MGTSLKGRTIVMSGGSRGIGLADLTAAAREGVKAVIPADRFGGVDTCLGNAGAIDLRGTGEVPVKRFDLVQSIDTRGTFLPTRACLPHKPRSGLASALL